MQELLLLQKCMKLAAISGEISGHIIELKTHHFNKNLKFTKKKEKKNPGADGGPISVYSCISKYPKIVNIYQLYLCSNLRVNRKMISFVDVVM